MVHLDKTNWMHWQEVKRLPSYDSCHTSDANELYEQSGGWTDITFAHQLQRPCLLNWEDRGIYSQGMISPLFSFRDQFFKSTFGAFSDRTQSNKEKFVFFRNLQISLRLIPAIGGCRNRSAGCVHCWGRAHGAPDSHRRRHTPYIHSGDLHTTTSGLCFHGVSLRHVLGNLASDTFLCVILGEGQFSARPPWTPSLPKPTPPTTVSWKRMKHQR